MKRTIIGLAGILSVATAVASAGGWGVITVTALPDHVVVGDSLVLTFIIRGHGTTPTTGMEASLEARSGSSVINVAATADARTSRYNATLLLPHAGDWTVTIRGGSEGYATTRLSLRAINPGDVAPPIPVTERGRRLFAAKGCVTCHVLDAFASQPTPSLQVGPTLTGKRYDADWLRRQLANPPASGIRRKDGWGMPNLQLTDDEISALVVFLNREDRTVEP